MTEDNINVLIVFASIVLIFLGMASCESNVAKYRDKCHSGQTK